MSYDVILAAYRLAEYRIRAFANKPAKHQTWMIARKSIQFIAKVQKSRSVQEKRNPYFCRCAKVNLVGDMANPEMKFDEFCLGAGVLKKGKCRPAK